MYFVVTYCLLVTAFSKSVVRCSSSVKLSQLSYFILKMTGYVSARNMYGCNMLRITYQPGVHNYFLGLCWRLFLWGPIDHRSGGNWGFDQGWEFWPAKQNNGSSGLSIGLGW